MKKYFLSVVLLISHYLGHAQKLLSEINLGSSPMGIDVRGMVVDDGIFLSIDQGEFTKSFWVQQDGSLQKVDLRAIENKFLFAVTVLGDSTYYYYLEEETKKNVTIKAWTLNNQTGKGKISSQQIDLPGKLFGTHTGDGNLYLLCALKGSFTLRLVHIQGMQISKETNFPLSFDLGKNKKATVSYFSGGAMEMPAQAAASVKITKDENAIWITLDEPMADYDRTVTESTLFKTSVIRLDLATGTSSVKSFFDPSHYHFNSAVFKGHLFRVIRDDGFRMEVFNVETSKKVYAMKMSPTGDHKNDMAYSRFGAKLTMSREPLVKQILKMQTPNFVIADSTVGGELILTVGQFGQNTPTVPVVSTFGLIGALVSLASTVAIHELSDGPYFYQYFYLKGSINDGFKFTNETSLIRQRIDDYEIEKQAGKIRFKYKGYLSDSSGVYALYLESKSSSLQIVKFEK